MEDTGLKSPTATGDDWNEWTDPTFAFTDDGQFAWTGHASGNMQDYFDFSLGVPIGATILGIEVQVKWKGENESGGDYLIVELSADGGANYTSMGVYKFRRLLGTDTWGGPAYLWGREWTAEELSNTNFRARIKEDGGIFHFDPYVDHIQVKVYYTQTTFYDSLYPSLYPVIGLQIHGKIGKAGRKSDYTPHGWWIHKEYKQYKVVAKYYYPENPRTGEQQGFRSVFYDAVKNWQGFDAATKDFYNQLTRPTVMSGYNRYLRFYLEANYPMIIYWQPLKQSASQDVTIPDYVASGYIPSVHSARNIYWEGQPGGSGKPLRIPDYVSSGYVPSVHFARNIYWEGQSRGSGMNQTLPLYFCNYTWLGVSRVREFSVYPTGCPYGTIIYRTDHRQFFGFRKDRGWVQL